MLRRCISPNSSPDYKINSSNRKLLSPDGDVELSSHSFNVNPTSRLIQIIIYFAVLKDPTVGSIGDTT